MDAPLKAAVLMGLSAADAVPSSSSIIAGSSGGDNDDEGSRRSSSDGGRGSEKGKRERERARKSHQHQHQHQQDEERRRTTKTKRRKTLFAPDSNEEDPREALRALHQIGYAHPALCRGLASTLYNLERLGLGHLDALPASAQRGLYVPVIQ